jgi:plastocyanin
LRGLFSEKLRKTLSMNKTCTLTLLAVLGAGVTLRAGDISGTVTLKGTPPAEAQIPAAKENDGCGKFFPQVPTTHHYVVGKNGELANVVVALKSVPNAPKGDSMPAAVLDQKNCTYVPQIMAVETGQKVLIKNSDPVTHNVHTVPVAGNKDMNQAQAQSAPDLTYVPTKPENFLKFQCDVHNWMFAWVSVFDHPYFAVTDENGKYTIKNVPDGKYTIQAFHRKAAPASAPKTAEIEVKGGAVTQDFALEVPAAK